MLGFKNAAEHAVGPLLRWSGAAYFNEPLLTRSPLVEGHAPSTKAKTNSPSLVNHELDWFNAAPLKQAQKIKTMRESDQLLAQLHQAFGPSIELAINQRTSEPLPRPVSLPVNVSILPGALSLEALGIPDRAGRAQAQGKRVFFGDDGTQVMRGIQGTSEQQRVLLAQELLALSKLPVGREAVKEIASSSMTTRFFAINEKKDNWSAIEYVDGFIFGAARYWPHTWLIGINARLLDSWERNFVFGTPAADPHLDRANLFMHEINHILDKKSGWLSKLFFQERVHKTIGAMNRFFNRMNGLVPDDAAHMLRLTEKYKASPAIESYSRAFLYVQLDKLMQRIQENPEMHEQIILSHLRDQAALGVNVERYVNWLLPELDKRLPAQEKI